MQNEHQDMLTIGLLLDNLYDNYQSFMWESILGCARERNVNLLCYMAGSIDSPEPNYAEKNVLYDLITADNTDGIIVFSGSIGNYLTYKSFVRFLGRFEGIPGVSIGIPIAGMPAVCTDNEKGIDDIVSHIVDGHGRKKIAFIRGPEESFDATHRLAAYKKALITHGIEYDESLVVPGNFLGPTGKEAVRLLVDERHADFDALVGANDYMAIYAMAELASRGIRVPEDVLVVGFDNIRDSFYVEPPLTTVEQPMFELGRKALDTLLAIIGGEKVPEIVMLPPRVIVRRSCGCFLTDSVKEIRETDSNPDYGAKGKTAEETCGRIGEAIAGEYPEISMRLNLRGRVTELAYVLVSWNDATSDPEFFRLVERLTRESLGAGIDVSRLYGPVVRLFSLCKPLCAGKTRGTSFDQLEERVLVFIGVSAENAQKRMWIRMDDQSLILSRMSREFIHTFDYSELVSLLANGFPKLGIRIAFLALYADSTRKLSRLFFSMEKGEIALNTTERYFPSDMIVPGNIKDSSRRLSLIILPLYFEKENLGYLVMEIGATDGSVYEMLGVQVASALKGASLVEEVQNYANGLESKVKERTAELERLNRELELANEQKTRFFINIAHETKSPLTLIKNYLDKYLKTRENDEDLAIVKANIDKLLRDMVNFLDSEKLERGQIFYNHAQVVNMTELMDMKVVLFREFARKKQIFLKNSASADGLYVKADPHAMDRIVNNLLDNAIKYTNRGGTITVSLFPEGESVVLEVADTGIGMSEEQMSSVFEPYYQLTHKKRNVEGIGMGLYIVKEIVSSLGAKMRLESRENEGSRFRIEFKRYAPLDGEEIPAGTGYSIPIRRVSVFADAKQAVIVPQKHVVLLVDDNPEMLSFLHSELKDKYNVVLAENGKDALGKMDLIPIPDIIVSDVMMHEMDGHELFLNLLKLDEYKHIPFIFLSARSTMDEKLRGLEEGAIDYISKPFVIDELVAKIDSVILNQVKQKKAHIKQVGARIMESLQSMEPEKPDREHYVNLDLICKKYRISSREREVIVLLAKGLLNKEISDRLAISIKTLDSHIHNIYRKINVQNKVELINLLKS